MNFKGLFVLGLTVASIGYLKPASGQEFEEPTVDVALKMAHEAVSSDMTLEVGRCLASTVYLNTYGAELLPAVEEIRLGVKSLSGSAPEVIDIVRVAKSRGWKTPSIPQAGIVIRLHPTAQFDRHIRHSQVGCAVAIAKAVLPNSSLSNLGEIRIVRDPSLNIKPFTAIWIEFSEGAK